ncbi:MULTISPECIES: diacylglycerol kinase family protein [unclassified Mucilaginibacter]|uniref:diacylglycerol kinase family protein n=1 Tax=unclassified Mucilaginibacter TaxID=2617802 RepID=UPI0009663DE8|nr:MULTISPECIES: diacylglycerol kinase family protein [unclassified Mucilaginibacter]OJW16422.1 MAG: diacylglycerol kinase [Mucilaginibacter sp. 44-25]PLW91006.1 MAG: diacylglycerol kinase [Mucilaginibacter sp.]HEK21681.1 diacylglycerol kinase family protein [Bacteroidota bacterium]
MKKLIRSFGFAFKGFRYAFTTQQNFRIHVFAAIAALLLGWYLHISVNEWQWVILCIMLMLVTEMLNTAIEALTDLVSPDYNKLAGHVKDISAGAVLLVALFSLVTGGIIFLPKIIHLFHAA